MIWPQRLCKDNYFQDAYYYNQREYEKNQYYYLSEGFSRILKESSLIVRKRPKLSRCLLQSETKLTISRSRGYSIWMCLEASILVKMWFVDHLWMHSLENFRTFASLSFFFVSCSSVFLFFSFSSTFLLKFFTTV